MTDTAYIVVNEQQEHEVLEVLFANGMKYFGGSSSQFRPLTGFPYVIYESDNSNVLKSGRVPKIKYSTDILYDGRKEEKMSEKYVVSQEFMSNLKNWKKDLMTYGKTGYFVGYMDIGGLPVCVYDWLGENISNEENNNRLIAIIRWVNGEDVFEVEKPKKWVVRSKEHDEGGHYQYVIAGDFDMSFNEYHIEHATRFSTKEEAESWANSHQEVIEVDG